MSYKWTNSLLSLAPSCVLSLCCLVLPSQLYACLSWHATHGVFQAMVKGRFSLVSSSSLLWCNVFILPLKTFSMSLTTYSYFNVSCLGLSLWQLRLPFAILLSPSGTEEDVTYFPSVLLRELDPRLPLLRKRLQSKRELLKQLQKMLLSFHGDLEPRKYLALCK